MMCAGIRHGTIDNQQPTLRPNFYSYESNSKSLAMAIFSGRPSISTRQKFQMTIRVKKPTGKKKRIGSLILATYMPTPVPTFNDILRNQQSTVLYLTSCKQSLDTSKRFKNTTMQTKSAVRICLPISCTYVNNKFIPDPVQLCTIAQAGLLIAGEAI